MALGCGRTFIKYALFVLNIINLVAAIAVIVLSAISLSQVSGLSDATYGTDVVLIVMLTCAVVSALVAFFGCCGAIRQSVCMLYTYSTGLSLSLLTKGILGIVLFTQINDLMAELQRYLERTWRERAQQTEFWDNVQQTFRCCGLTGPSNWLEGAATALPNSCCAAGQPTIGIQTCSMADAFTDGCSTSFEDVIRPTLVLIAAVALVQAAVELTVMVFTCVLINGIRRENRLRNY